jgi:hypothetical protein
MDLDRLAPVAYRGAAELPSSIEALWGLGGTWRDGCEKLEA